MTDEGSSAAGTFSRFPSVPYLPAPPPPPEAPARLRRRKLRPQIVGCAYPALRVGGSARRLGGSARGVGVACVGRLSSELESYARCFFIFFFLILL